MTVATIFAYTMRSCLPPRRLVAVLFACAGTVLFGLLAHAVTGQTTDRAFANIAAEGICALTVPIAALVVGDAVLGAELRSGTFHFTWLSPVPTWQIILGRWLAGVAVVTITVVPSSALAAVVSGSSSSAGPLMIGTGSGAVAYVAVFLAIGCLTKRTAVWSLAVVFLIERLLGAVLTGIAQISPQWQGRSAFVGLLDDPPGRLVRDGIPLGASAVGRLAVICLVALGVATWRLRHLTLSGASD